MLTRLRLNCEAQGFQMTDQAVLLQRISDQLVMLERKLDVLIGAPLTAETDERSYKAAVATGPGALLAYLTAGGKVPPPPDHVGQAR